MSTANVDIFPDQMFDVEVLVHDAFALSPNDELLGFGFNVQSSGAGNLQFLGSTVNASFTDTSADVGLDVAGFAFPGLTADSVGSVFTLATLHFQALLAGNVSLAVIGDVADFNQGLIFFDRMPFAIDAGLRLNIAAVPLPPSSWLFFSAGLFALVGRRKQSRRGQSVLDR